MISAPNRCGTYACLNRGGPAARPTPPAAAGVRAARAEPDGQDTCMRILVGECSAFLASRSDG